MTFTEITTEVQEALARTDTAVTTKIATWVNRRQRMAASRHNFSFMRTLGAAMPTVVNQQAYTLPTDYKDDHAFYILKTDSHIPLEIGATLSALVRYSPADTGEPEFITVDPGTTTFKVWPPKPNAVYSILPLYFAWPADLSGAQTNWFTDNFPGMLIAGGVAEGLDFLGASEDTPKWEQRFEEAFRRAKAHDVERALPQRHGIVPRWDVAVGQIARERDGWRF